ncbi:MAG: peptidylprolyl isomerase [Bacteroidota bacterium]
MDFRTKIFTFLVLLTLTFSCDFDSTKYAVIETEFGDIRVMLYDSTPKHTENFEQLVEEGFYDDLLFHRIMNQFMIQGGDPDSKDAPQGQRLGMGGPGYMIDAEIGAIHKRGALAAARDNNPEMKSSGSQFYIVHGREVDTNFLDMVAQRNDLTYTEEEKAIYLEQGGAPFLDGQYTVFGEVVEGMDVVDRIANQVKDSYDRPLEDIKMKIRMD